MTSDRSHSETWASEQARSDAVNKARARRAHLLDAAGAVELAIAGPARAAGWGKRLAAELEDLLQAWREHIDEVEGPDGLLASVRADEPRLAHTIENLGKGHGAIRIEAEAVLDLIENDGTPSDIRSAGLNLLHSVALHRHKGSDLVWEAYNVDIGGGG
jgi:hypothetical protein